jgi:hypothetical protein
MPRARPSLAERFWAKVARAGPEDCWLWQARAHHAGYGVLNRGGGSRSPLVRAHRLSWELHVGTIPTGMQVLHTCDIPACVNPAHLFLGTPADNARDSARKGRKRGRPVPGPVILAVLASTEPARILAKRFGLPAGTVNRYRSPSSPFRAWRRAARVYGEA